MIAVRYVLPAVVALVGVVILVVEPTLLGLVPSVGRFAPLQGAPSGLIGIGIDDDTELLDAGVAGLVMLGWLTVLFAAAGALLRRRDLT